MKSLFADASFYLAVVGPSDVWHQVASDFSRNRLQVVTTEYVLAEVANLLSRVGDRGVFVQLFHQIESDRNTTIVASSNSLWLRGLRLYADRFDKNWSLTDCISFVVMQDHGLTEALTADRHFEQAGFTILLK